MRLLLCLLAALAAAPASAERLTLDRIHGETSLAGPGVKNVRVSPDGERVTFLRGRTDNQFQQDLWEYNMKDKTTRLLVHSKKLVPNETLSLEEKARRERARTASLSGIINYTWAPSGKQLLVPIAGDLYLVDVAQPDAAGLRTGRVVLVEELQRLAGEVAADLPVGDAAAADLHFILRDFEREGLGDRGALIEQVCATLQATEPRAKITCTITEQYRNMRYWLENDMRPVELAREACRNRGIEHFSQPIRGGTDGSRLTERGVPTPNLFTGMQNIHGPHEWVSVQDMSRATEMCIELAQLWSRESGGARTAGSAGESKAPADAESPVDWTG